MSTTAIQVEGLWKEYVIGAGQQHHATFYDLLSSSLAAPFRRLRKLGGHEESDKRFWALRDVHFDVCEGEVFGIIGRNGAGKSTLLKILSRITAPTRGRVTIRGQIASLLEVGTGFHPELSGRENIYLNGALLGMTRAEIARKFDSIVDFAEIETFIDTPVKRYSSGMYVRLAFSVASHLEPEILIVDEVLAVGDFDFQRKCLGKMQDVSGKGRTVIFVSHNMHAIQILCPRVLLLGGGEVRSVGAAGPIIQEYLDNSEDGRGIVESDAGTLRLISATGACEPVSDNDLRITIRLTLEAHVDIRDLLIDFGLENSQGVRLLQIVPLARGASPSAIAAGSRPEYCVIARTTMLAPGDYFGTIYAHSRLGGVMLHQSNIALFRVMPDENAPECISQGFTAALLPSYEARIVLERD